jgi:hypothetical protein
VVLAILTVAGQQARLGAESRASKQFIANHSRAMIITSLQPVILSHSIIKEIARSNLIGPCNITPTTNLLDPLVKLHFPHSPGFST